MRSLTECPNFSGNSSSTPAPHDEVFNSAFSSVFQHHNIRFTTQQKKKLKSDKQHPTTTNRPTLLRPRTLQTSREHVPVLRDSLSRAAALSPASRLAHCWPGGFQSKRISVGRSRLPSISSTPPHSSSSQKTGHVKIAKNGGHLGADERVAAKRCHGTLLRSTMLAKKKIDKQLERDLWPSSSAVGPSGESYASSQPTNPPPLAAVGHKAPHRRGRQQATLLLSNNTAPHYPPVIMGGGELAIVPAAEEAISSKVEGSILPDKSQVSMKPLESYSNTTGQRSGATAARAIFQRRNCGRKLKRFDSADWMLEKHAHAQQLISVLHTTAVEPRTHHGAGGG